MVIHKIYIGGWFQRTTLHLTEIWDFLNNHETKLDLDKNELKHSIKLLQISSLSREGGDLEYIKVVTKLGIDFKIYEDGLIVLEKDFKDLKSDFKLIKDYYDNKLSKVISLIFSKGAPVPKELANIKTILPYIVTTSRGIDKSIMEYFDKFDEEVYSKISSNNIDIYRSSGMIFINNFKEGEQLSRVIESQIFFREFKSQLHRYLEIHRTLWERIKEIKERGEINGAEVEELRNELYVYQKTINLIGARIDQMPAYVRTRQKLTDINSLDKEIGALFYLKFETLLDTHEYIKHLWGMTKNYLNQALDMMNDLQSKSTKNTISSLQLVTTIGVVAGILGYLSKESMPIFTSIGLFYFALLMAMTWCINYVVSRFYKNKKYKIESKDLDRRIG